MKDILIIRLVKIRLSKLITVETSSVYGISFQSFLYINLLDGFFFLSKKNSEGSQKISSLFSSIEKRIEALLEEPQKVFSVYMTRWSLLYATPLENIFF